MRWKPEIEELHERQELARRMGGEEKVERQHHYGKLTIRERIDHIIDEGSFQEIGALAGVGSYGEDGRLESFTPSNFVLGMAEIGARPVVVSGDDFTVRGGSADASIKAKRMHAEGLALDLRLPHGLVDGMGGGGSVKTIEMVWRTYIPRLGGWNVVAEHLAIALGVAGTRIGGRHRRGPGLHQPLLGDRSRHRDQRLRTPSAELPASEVSGLESAAAEYLADLYDEVEAAATAEQKGEAIQAVADFAYASSRGVSPPPATRGCWTWSPPIMRPCTWRGWWPWKRDSEERVFSFRHR